jgi:hypothetical protein
MTTFGVLLMSGILGCLMSTPPGWAQGTTTSLPSASGPHTGEQARTQEQVAASDAVITIHGLCEPAKQSGTDEQSCTTVVTREAFEKLVDSMNVTNKALSQETRRNLAETYADYLTLERPAVQAKLAGTPQFAEVMRWWRLRTLADMYRGGLQAQFARPSAAEVHAYYTEQLPSFERIRVDRVLVPRDPGKSGEEKNGNDRALELAQAARERIVKGENPALVQRDIFTELKLDATPVTDLGTLGRSNFPKDEVDEVFSLEPGQVSKIEKEASYVIYKIKAKETLSEGSQTEEISREIAKRKFSDAMRVVNESAKPEFNDTYLGPHVAPAPSPHANAMTSPHP